jgi:hypothetical protein
MKTRAVDTEFHAESKGIFGISIYRAHNYVLTIRKYVNLRAREVSINAYKSLWKMSIREMLLFCIFDRFIFL